MSVLSEITPFAFTLLPVYLFTLSILPSFVVYVVLSHFFLSLHGVKMAIF